MDQNPGLPILGSVANFFELCASDYTRNALSHKNITTPTNVGLFKSNIPAFINHSEWVMKRGRGKGLAIALGLGMSHILTI